MNRTVVKTTTATSADIRLNQALTSKVDYATLSAVAGGLNHFSARPLLAAGLGRLRLREAT
jgi:hypothetical protein